MSYFREQLEKWLATLKINADVLIDIGGGAKPVLPRLGSRDVCKYVIMDNCVEPENLEGIQKHDFVEFDINYDLLSQRINPKNYQADVIFCLEVFEYVFDPLQAMHNIADMLKDSGVAYISFPFVYPMHEPIEYDYLRYTSRGVQKLAESVGLRRLNQLCPGK